jgi:asparagine synthase (glutamine-hydrolysing)
MNSVQRHRGPDDEGYWFDDARAVALAMRRLSIVDIAGGHQPMTDSGGRFTIVYNGEVFNAPSLRKELEAEGFSFRSDHSDTEVILNLFVREGAACVSRLNGMFAFAIYDAVEGKLFLARDPVGIKPLFYAEGADYFAFASELKSLTQLKALPREIDRQSLHHYLTLQFIPSPRTIYAGIRKLPAGHTLTYRIKEKSVEISRYWRPEFSSHPDLRSREDVVRELRVQLERSASAWMWSDVDVGFSLSGGIDSAALVGLLARRGGGRLMTWTLGFEESAADAASIDERALASLVASRWGTEHHEIVIKASAVVSDLEDMVQSLDEPYAGGLPSWYVFKAMSQDVKVGIVGSGGDELFGNYGKWRVLQPFTLPWLKQLRRRLIDNGVTECARNPHGALYPGYLGERTKNSFYASRPADLQSTPALYEAMWREAGPDPKQAVANIDFQMQLPEEFLMMTDRFSMAWSLEARPPLLDKELVEFVMGIPSSIRSPADRLKGLLIDAVRDLLPDELISARKRGFVLPLADWLRNDMKPMVKAYFSPEFLRRQGIFRQDLYQVLAKPHIDGHMNAASSIWTVLMFQLWWDHQAIRAQ